nr:T9SS type A sorting domain-containing protein [Melioribacteraceae bacterium]
DVEVQEGATSISIRLHPLGKFQGTVWMDALKISVISATDVNGDNTIPNEFALSQNYPNPFNPTTIIEYSIREVSNVKLRVYDMLGREVKVLVNQEQSAGRYNIEFNAANLSSGVYFYRIEAGNFVASKKLLLLK